MGFVLTQTAAMGEYGGEVRQESFYLRGEPNWTEEGHKAERRHGIYLYPSQPGDRQGTCEILIEDIPKVRAVLAAVEAHVSRGKEGDVSGSIIAAGRSADRAVYRTVDPYHDHRPGGDAAGPERGRPAARSHPGAVFGRGPTGAVAHPKEPGDWRSGDLAGAGRRRPMSDGWSGPLPGMWRGS